MDAAVDTSTAWTGAKPGSDPAATRSLSIVCDQVTQRPGMRTENRMAAASKATQERIVSTFDKETQCDRNTFDEIAGFLYKEGHFDDTMHTGSIIFATPGGITLF